MVQFAVAAVLSFALTTLAIPAPFPLTPDPSGDKNIGNAKGQQFITGACLSDADCASTCCAKLNGGGICSGLAVSFAQGKQGCGFSSSGAAAPPPAASSAAAAPPPAAPAATQPAASTGGATSAAGATIDTSKPGSQNVGLANGSQFITGQCFSNADCASACCATLNGAGQCSGPAVAFDAGKQGCGFTVSGAAAAPATAAVAAAPPAAGAVTSTVDTSKPGSQNVGLANGSQFITGQCLSNADCASGCCAKLNGAGQCSGPAVSFDAGKQGCGFVGTLA